MTSWQKTGVSQSYATRARIQTETDQQMMHVSTVCCAERQIMHLPPEDGHYYRIRYRRPYCRTGKSLKWRKAHPLSLYTYYSDQQPELISAPLTPAGKYSWMPVTKEAR